MQTSQTKRLYAFSQYWNFSPMTNTPVKFNGGVCHRTKIPILAECVQSLCLTCLHSCCRSIQICLCTRKDSFLLMTKRELEYTASRRIGFFIIRLIENSRFTGNIFLQKKSLRRITGDFFVVLKDKLKRFSSKLRPKHRPEQNWKNRLKSTLPKLFSLLRFREL